MNGVGKLFTVGYGISTIQARVWFRKPSFIHPIPSHIYDDMLQLNEIVVVVEPPQKLESGQYFWRILSRLGLVWAMPDCFSNEGIE